MSVIDKEIQEMTRKRSFPISFYSNKCEFMYKKQMKMLHFDLNMMNN